jgi:hypothetical protein
MLVAVPTVMMILLRCVMPNALLAAGEGLHFVTRASAQCQFASNLPVNGQMKGQ